MPDLEWLDGGGTRFHKGGSAPPEVKRGVARAAQGNPTWRAEPQSRDGALIEVTSMRVYKPLHGAPVATTDDYDMFGLTQRPTDQISRACIAGCARLVAAGGADGGDKDFEAMVEALEQTASAAADAVRRFFQISQAQAQQPSTATASAPRTSGNLAWPTDHLVVTDPFGSTANRPNPHTGVDIRARLNDSIYSIEDGVVVGIYVAAGAGHVIIEFVSGGFGLYAHVSATVAVGQTVLAGEKIAVSDASGTKHAHLHYGYVSNGTVSQSGRVSGPRVDAIASQIGAFQYTVK